MEIKKVEEDRLAAELKAKQEAEVKAAAELKAKQESEVKAAATKKITITCLKGKLVTKVTGVKPVCPKGYKKK
jgi:F0F1-type ATP synthase delta subunit